MRPRLLLLILAGVMVAGRVAEAAAPASRAPVNVSPGGPSSAPIGDGCPTFSWGGVEGASGYELVVYRLGFEGEEAQVALRQRLPAAAGSWTPSLDRCLEAPGRYAWSMRAVGHGQASEWSPPSLFELAPAPSLSQIEETLEVLRSSVERLGGMPQRSAPAAAPPDSPLMIGGGTPFGGATPPSAGPLAGGFSPVIEFDPNEAGSVGIRVTGAQFGIEAIGTDGAGGFIGVGVEAVGHWGIWAIGQSIDGYGGVITNSLAGTALLVHGQGQAKEKAALRVRNDTQHQGMAAYLTNDSSFATAHFANAGNGQVLWLENGGTDGGGTGGGDFITAVNKTGAPFDVQFRVTTTGQVFSDVGFTTPAADFAEMLPGAAGLEAGDVLVIGASGRLERSSRAHQSNVAGVHSAEPGFTGGLPVDGPIAGTVPLAVVGVVTVKVVDEGGAIRPGDLLVTSSTAGHAMRAGRLRRAGTVIGKALEALAGERGNIRMLAVLQ